MSLKVVAISGWKGSGKDTMADYLIKNHAAVRVSFADPLKDNVAAAFGVDRTHLDIQSKKEVAILSMPVNPQDKFSRVVAEFMIKEFRDTHNVAPHSFTYQGDEFYGVVKDDRGVDINVRVYWTPRALAILEGSTKRTAASNYWVQQAVKKIREYGAQSDTEMVVISDLRYKSELMQLKSAFGSDLVEIRVERFDSSLSSDPSERDLDDYPFSYRIDNRGDLAWSYEQLEEFVLGDNRK